MADYSRRQSRADRRRFTEAYKGKERRRSSPRDVVIEAEYSEECVTIKLQNELVAANCESVKEELLKAHFELPVSSMVVLDLQGVPYADSGAVAMLLELHERLKRNGKKLVLKNLTEYVARLIEVFNLTQVFNIQS